jgi:hypothetical protein
LTKAVGLLVLLAIASLAGAGCIDRGFVVIAENQTNQALLARSSIVDDYGARPLVGHDQRVVMLPPGSRLVIAEEPFAGPRFNLVEILGDKCSPIGQFDPVADGGIVIIDASLHLMVRREYPEGGERANEVTNCRTESPAPSAAAPS